MEKDTFLELNYTNWKDHTKEGLILLDFWAEWCSACVAQDKYYNELSEIYNSKLRIGKIHVGDNRFVADSFSVRNVPYLILINNGKEIARMSGIESKEYLISLIEREIVINENRT
jgi:thioredoxin-like negative regulator of GroEL